MLAFLGLLHGAPAAPVGTGEAENTLCQVPLWGRQRGVCQREACQRGAERNPDSARGDLIASPHLPHIHSCAEGHCLTSLALPCVSKGKSLSCLSLLSHRVVATI